MPWLFQSKSPVFLQILQTIRARILSGEYPPNSQIPPVRVLALDAGVNPNTMQRALSELERTGLIYSQGTVGRFVTSDESVLAAAREEVKRETLQRIADEARAAGITNEDLIAYFQKEESL